MKHVFFVGVTEGDCLYSDAPLNYSAYLLIGEKSCLIHTVPKEHAQTLMKHIEAIMPVAQLDYVVFLQTEPCYTGALESLLQKNPKLTVVAASAGLRNLKEQISVPFSECLAKDQGELDLGADARLRFAITPNLCWPDSMLCFLDCESCVFTADYQSTYLLPDGRERYFKDRLEGFSEYLPAAEKAIAAHACTRIFPGHGEQTEVCTYPQSVHEQIDVCICYDSIYGATKEMAEFLQKAFEGLGVSCACLSVRDCDAEKIQETLASAAGWLFGVPTMQRNASPRILSVMFGIHAAAAARKPVGVFGSYGWSGEGCGIAERYLQGLRARICQRSVRSIFTPDEKVKKELESMAQRMCEMLSEKE